MANIQVTHDSDANNARSESSLVINPNNPSQIVAASKKFNNIHTYDFTLATQYSTDGGQSWQDSPAFALPTGATVMTDPTMAWDDAGNVFMVGLVGNNPPAWSTIGIAIYKSTDGGQTWSAPKLIHQSPSDDKQWAAGDTNPGSPHHGNVYAVWDDYDSNHGPSNPTGRMIDFARTKDHGTNWIGPGTGSSPAGGLAISDGCYFPEINVGDDGTVYVAAIAGSDIHLHVSADGGDTFTAKPHPATGISPLGPGLAHPGSVEPLGVFPGGNFRVITDPTACAFGSTVIVAWADFREGVSRIYFARSTDGGNTWATGASGEKLLTASIPANFQHFHPQIVADANGVIGCTFYEFGPKPSTYKIDVLMTQSFDGGATFNHLTVTDQPWDPTVDAPWAHGDSSVTFIGDYFGLDAGANGFLPLWTDTRTGIQELFTSIVLGFPLEIDFDPSIDMCQRSFVENTTQTFRVTNLDVFPDQSGLVFSWSVTGAVPGATNTPSLTIWDLPAAGTTVTINVTVKNDKNVQAAGTLSFQTAANDLAAMTAELRCRITHIVNGVLRLPPWVPIERDGTLKEQLTVLEKQLSQVAQGLMRVNTLIGQMREFESRASRE